MTPFFIHKTAATADAAFAAARADGGPIASKTSYVVDPTPPNVNPDVWARSAVDRNWHQCAQTAAPAQCFALANSDFFFFGGIDWP